MSDVIGMLTPLSERPVLTVGDRCDRCGAQSYVRVVLAGGSELLFCHHHFNEHETSLTKVAVAIDDERERIAHAPAER